MTTKFSTKTPKSFNIWRRLFQYVTCNIVITAFIKLKYNLKIEGRDNIDKTRKYVVASNHVTGYDPFILAGQLNIPIAFMAKKQLFETFWSMVLMDWCGAFAVDRDKVDVSTIKTALSIQNTSWHLGMFPQGTRCNNGKIENITKGFASMAKKLKAEVLPVAIIVRDNSSSKKQDFIIKVGSSIPYNNDVDDMVAKWSESVSTLSGLEYIPS